MRNEEKSNGCCHRDFGLGKEDWGEKGQWKRKNKEIPEGNHTVVLNWIQMAKETGGCHFSSRDCKLLGRKVSQWHRKQ